MTASLQEILTISTIIILGIFSILSLLDKTRRDRAKLTSDETRELIEILQQKIKALEDRVTTTEADARAAKEEAIKVKAENGTLRELLQGRDEATIEFQKSVMGAVITAADTNVVVKENSKKLDAANKNIERLAKAIETHLDNYAKVK